MEDISRPGRIHRSPVHLDLKCYHVSDRLLASNHLYHIANVLEAHLLYAVTASRGKPYVSMPSKTSEVEEHFAMEPSDEYVNYQDPELHKIIPNSIYLTFNAPQVNEYVGVLSACWPSDP